MLKHWKKFVVAILVLVFLVFAASFIYAKFINQADDEFDSGDVQERLGTTTVAETATGTGDTTIGNAADGVDGVWLISEGSEVGYRVEEVLNGFDTTANGRTTEITGEFTIEGTQVTAGEFTVDMRNFDSGDSKRDAAFRGRIMEVNEFPTSFFMLTEPIDFGEIPADGTTVSATATGELTLHGVTNTVTFTLEATFQSGRVGVLGQIPILFEDYNIDNPSTTGGTIRVEDEGLLEFVLIFDRA